MNKVLIWILLVIAVIIAGPLLTIWSLNTLFPKLEIAYNISNWFAVILLGAALRANVTVNK